MQVNSRFSPTSEKARYLKMKIKHVYTRHPKQLNVERYSYLPPPVKKDVLLPLYLHERGICNCLWRDIILCILACGEKDIL